MEQIILKILKGALIIDIFILSGLFMKLFMNPFETPVAIAASETKEIGPATTDMIMRMEKIGLSPRDIGQVTRSSFSVRGRMVTLNKDNLQIFEYTDSDTAANEASALTLKYVNGSRSQSWKKQTHVHASGPLVMFYMGDDKPIVDFIVQN